MNEFKPEPPPLEPAAFKRGPEIPKIVHWLFFIVMVILAAILVAIP